MSIVLILILLVSACEFHDTRQGSQFNNVSIGMSKPEVIGFLGAPKFEEPCGTHFGVPYGVADCSGELIYGSAAAPVIPVYWTIFFDRNDRVTGKYLYQSP